MRAIPRRSLAVRFLRRGSSHSRLPTLRFCAGSEKIPVCFGQVEWAGEHQAVGGMYYPRTRQEFRAFFPENAACLAPLLRVRWAAAIA